MPGCTRSAVKKALGTIVFFGAMSGFALAQDMPMAATPPVSATPAAPGSKVTIPPTAANAAAPSTSAAQQLSQEQLDQLVAPIALYPDPLLSQILMASTYPLEIVEAARWDSAPGNQKLTGDALTDALKGQNWDPSVQALVPFPQLLQTMSNQLDWSQRLGNAFLAQQSDVMDAVQRLRHTALAAGNLQATPECHCTVQTSGDIISILPADPKVVCVPVYNPKVAFGTWSAPDYPPIAFPVPAGFAYAPGSWIGFEPPIELAVFGPLWGWGSLDWSNHRIAVDNGLYSRVAAGRPALAGGAWVHDPVHRGGVAYANPAVEARFGAAARTAAANTPFRPGLAAAGGRFGAAHPPAGSGGPFATHAVAPGGAARFGPGAVHGGSVARGLAPVARGHAAPANFAPGGHPGGGPARGPAPGGGPRGGAPHAAGGGDHHH